MKLLWVTLLAMVCGWSGLRADLWSGSEGEADGWKYVDWLGWFWSESEGPGWIYTEAHGWQYATGDSQEAVYFWSEDVGWLYSGSGAYPSVYFFGSDGWYFFNKESISAYPFDWWNYAGGLWESRQRIAFGQSAGASVPEGLTLKKSIVLIRHGERLPELVFPKGTQWPGFLVAKLTEVGKLEEYYLGTLFRERLVSGSGLLPSHYDASMVLAISSEASRCVESAEAFFEGLYGDDESKAIRVDESVFGLVVNAEAQALLNQIQAGEAWQGLAAELAQGYAANWQAWSGFSEVVLMWTQAEGEVSVYDVGDTLLYNWIKGYPQPLGFGTSDVEAAWSFFNRSSRLIYENRELSRLIGGPMLAAVVAALEGKGPDNEETDAVFFLLSGHDSNFWPVLGALGTDLEANPHFASFLEFAVYEDAEGNALVGVSYNGSPVDLTPVWGHPGLCPLATFVSYLK